MATTAIILGGIPAGQGFIWVTKVLINGTMLPAVLNSAPLGAGIIYYWETNMTVAFISSIPVFSATTTVTDAGKTTALLITDTINPGGVAYRSDGLTLGHADLAAPLIVTNPTYAPWGDPFVVLANIPYSITVGDKLAQIYTGSTTASATINAQNIYFLPVTSYGDCTTTTAPVCQQITDPHAALRNWYCINTPGSLLCSGPAPLNPSWVSLPDASSHLIFNYCLAGTGCGDKTGTDPATSCRGPCPDTYNDCNPTITANKEGLPFQCVLNPGRYVTTVKWYQSPYFIAALIFVVIMIILVIIVAIAILRKI
jgi:hypothetical protein